MDRNVSINLTKNIILNFKNIYKFQTKDPATNIQLMYYLFLLSLLLPLVQDQIICILRFKSNTFIVSSPWDADYHFLVTNVEHLNQFILHMLTCFLKDLYTLVFLILDCTASIVH